MNYVQVLSTTRAASLEFSAPYLPNPHDLTAPAYGFTVTLRSRGLSARARIALNSEDGDAPALAQLFIDMARDWRGWRGEKGGLFGDRLALACMHDSVGHVRVRVDLDSDGWRVSDYALEIEPGTLAKLAAEIVAFLRVEPPADA